MIEIDDTFRGSEGKDSGDLIELFLYNCQLELGGDSDFPDMSIDQREQRLIYFDLYYKNSRVRSIISELFSFEITANSKCFNCGVPFYNISTENSLMFSLESVYNYFIHNKELINNIKKLGINTKYISKIKDIKEEFNNKTFVLTGTLESLTRNEAKDIIESLGGKITNSVSKKTDVVIVGANPGSKYDEAIKLGITLWSEEEFLSRR